MLKAIVFDFDGVLVNTYENHYQTYARKYKDLSREDHKRLFEGNIHEMRVKLEVKDENFNYVAGLGKFLLTQELAPDILSILRKLKQKFSLFIITSHRESVLKEFFNKQELKDLFDHVYGLETHRRKEFKFRRLFDDYDLTNKEVIFITDTLGDILAANKLGVKTIAVEFGFHDRKRLEKGKPLKIVSSFEEIVSLVQKLS